VKWKFLTVYMRRGRKPQVSRSGYAKQWAVMRYHNLKAE
jgi:hypothetical protein